VELLIFPVLLRAPLLDEKSLSPAPFSLSCIQEAINLGPIGLRRCSAPHSGLWPLRPPTSHRRLASTTQDEWPGIAGRCPSNKVKDAETASIFRLVGHEVPAPALARTLSPMPLVPSKSLVAQAALCLAHFDSFLSYTCCATRRVAMGSVSVAREIAEFRPKTDKTSRLIRGFCPHRATEELASQRC
jgi:hypothetical protein